MRFLRTSRELPRMEICPHHDNGGPLAATCPRTNYQRIILVGVKRKRSLERLLDFPHILAVRHAQSQGWAIVLILVSCSVMLDLALLAAIWDRPCPVSVVKIQSQDDAWIRSMKVGGAVVRCVVISYHVASTPASEDVTRDCVEAVIFSLSPAASAAELRSLSHAPKETTNVIVTWLKITGLVHSTVVLNATAPLTAEYQVIFAKSHVTLSMILRPIALYRQTSLHIALVERLRWIYYCQNPEMIARFQSHDARISVKRNFVVGTSANRSVIKEIVGHVFSRVRYLAVAAEHPRSLCAIKAKWRPLVVAEFAEQLSTVDVTNVASVVALGRRKPVSVKLRSVDIVLSLQDQQSML